MLLYLIHYEIILALALGIFFPIILLVSKYSKLNVSRRYITSAIVVVLLYALLCLAIPSNYLIDFSGLLLLLSILIFFLGVWGLLTRGYSVAILIALHSVGGKATTIELEKNYSGGRGLRWLTAKRLDGLTVSKTIKIEKNQITIRKPLGLLLIKLNKIFKFLFRLKGYG